MKAPSGAFRLRPDLKEPGCFQFESNKTGDWRPIMAGLDDGDADIQVGRLVKLGAVVHDCRREKAA